jgi:hypothetical protein
MNQEDCKHEKVLYHFVGVPPYDGKFFEKFFECQICGLTYSVGTVPFQKEMVEATLYPAKDKRKG